MSEWKCKNAHDGYHYLTGYINGVLNDDEELAENKLRRIANFMLQLQEQIDEAKRDEMRAAGYCLVRAGKTAEEDEWV